MGGNAHWWDAASPLLSNDFQCCALDLRGHGDSAWARPPGYEIEDFAADIAAVQRHFGWHRLLIAAHSMGARATLHYAASNPDALGAMVLIDFLTDVSARASRKFRKPLARRQPHYRDPAHMIERFHLEPPETLLAKQELRQLAAHCIKEVAEGLWTWKFDWQAFGMSYPPVWELLPRIQVPTLLVRGEHSAIMPRRSFQRVLQELKGSAGVEIPHAHHHVMLDSPIQLAEAIRAFLKSTPVGSDHERTGRF